MKKTTLCLYLALLASFFMGVDAQVLNQNANWPNTNWSLTGTYSTATGAVEADPTVDANFAFDDDDAGNPSDDSIAAESPIIDLTPAFNAGETWITVSLDYVFRKLSAEEFLRIQYYDADSMTWVNWEPESMPGNDTVLTDDFCSGTPVPYTSLVLDISGLSAQQQSGFRYRFLYDDDPNGGAWEYGFCLNSPTITSALPPSCPQPISLMASAINTTEATLSWTEFGSASVWNVEIVDVTGGGSQTMTPTNSGVTNPFVATMLTPGNDYEFYVQADCGGSTSAWSGPMAWSQPLPGSVCEAPISIGALPYSTSDDTANYGDDYSGTPGTDCGSGNNYLNGDDVVYEYTASSDTSINVLLSNLGANYAGIFVYADCSDIGTACVTGAINAFSTDDLEFDLSVTNGETYYFVISTWATPQSTTYDLNITENTCTDATVSYTVVDDCDNSGGFIIAVDITDLGSATSITISDDQGGSQQINAIGTYDFGPYVNATDVVITVADDNDANCVQMSGTLTQQVCPPSNDLCENAIPIACGDTLIDQTSIGATGGSGTSCNGSIGDDVWYQFTGDGSEVTITVDASVQEGQIGIYESSDGTCAGFTLGTCIASVDDLGGNPTSVTFVATMGNEYFIQVGNWINGDPGLIFEISATCTTCPDPSGMTLDAVTSTSADVSWTAGNSETSWNLEWAAGADFTPGNGEEDDTAVANPSPTATLSDLTAETTYFVYYQADCGGDTSAWVGPFTFFTGYCIPTGTSDQSYIDNFSTSGGLTNISNLGSGFATDNYQDNFDTSEVTGFATSSFDFTVEIVGGTVGCAVWVDWNNDLLFDASEVAFSTTGYGNGPFTGTVTVPGGTPNGDYRLRVLVDWNDANPGDDDACSFGAGRGEVEDYKVVVGDAPNDELDFYNLQFPANGTIAAGGEFLVYAQCFEAGLTDTTSGQAPGIEAWIGYSDADTDPSGAGWTWIPANFNVEVGNNDEYFIDLGGQINDTGTFYYASRWRLNGALFTYGGIQADGSFGGQWGNNNNISGVLTINPPSNDDCDGAIALTPGADFAANAVDGTVVGATIASETNDCGLNGPGVWYSVVVPGDGNITIETGPDMATGNTAFDSVIEAYSGACGTLTLIECDDDGADTFNFSILELTGLTPGETIYIRVWEYNGDESEPFAISAYNTTLSLSNFSFENGFKYFPNPVKNILSLRAQDTIQNVKVFNIIGQEVLFTSPNANNSDLDLSNLNAGAYIVQITINDVSKSIRVIKE